MTDRLSEGQAFSKLVENHIQTYTTQQYGNLNLQDADKGDVLQGADIPQLQTNMLRYANRMTTNSRGKPEALRDLLKLAHYCAIAGGKYDRNEVSSLYNDDTITLNVDNITNIGEYINDKLLHQNITNVKEIILKY